MKKFFEEFRVFITRGNVLDLAVGVIIGGAFTAIVNSLSDLILRPIVNGLLVWIFGKNSLSGIYTFLVKAYQTDETGKRVIDLKNSVYIDWGGFLNAVINFVIIAFVLFCIVRAVNKTREKLQEKKEELIAKREESAQKKEE